MNATFTFQVTHLGAHAGLEVRQSLASAVSHLFPKALKASSGRAVSPSLQFRADCPLPDLKQRAPGFSWHNGILQRGSTVESGDSSSIYDVFRTSTHSEDEQGQGSSGYQIRSPAAAKLTLGDFEKDERHV